jgi:hypothetical protein
VGARRALSVGASREPRGWASSRAVVDTLVGSELRSPLAPTPGIDVGRRYVELLERALASRLLHGTPRRRGHGSSTVNQAVIPAPGDEQVDRRALLAQPSFPNGTGILGRLSLLDRAESGSLADSAARATMQKRGSRSGDA